MKRNIILTALAVIAAGLTAIVTGYLASPVAAVLAVFVWLRFFGHVRWPVALIVFTVAHMAAWELSYFGTMPIRVFLRTPMFSTFALVFGLVFLTHIWAMRQWRNVLATITLPCGWVIIEFASASLSPTGSWGSISYTFLRWLPVAQMASVIGWVGVTFFAVWIAALADLVVLRGTRTRSAVGAATLGVVVIVVVFAFGARRIANAPIVEREVRVSAMYGPALSEVKGEYILRAHYVGRSMDDAQRAQLPALLTAYQDTIFTETARAIGNAELIVWSEALVWMSYDEEAAWIERGRAFAREHEVILAMSMAVFDLTRERLSLNKSVLIDEQGEILWEFLKARRVPGAGHVVGDGVLPAVKTRLGQIGGAICDDMDFPSLLRQAGQADTELLLVPSFDDEKVRWMHSRMAMMRAIEQGFTLIRPSAFGVSVVTDPFGRRLAERDAFTGRPFVMHATAPVMTVSTIYRRTGDVFAWACIGAFVFIIVLTVIAKARTLGWDGRGQQQPGRSV